MNSEISETISHLKTLRHSLCPGMSSMRSQDSETLYVKGNSNDDFIIKDDKTSHLNYP